MRRFRFIVLLLSLTLLATSGFAAEPRSTARPTPPQSVWVDTLVQSFRGFLRSFWSANGCFLDPLGRCVVKQTVDDGCGLDPLGRCANQPTTDDGCGIDPLGRCK
jgi:hypothetical protein